MISWESINVKLGSWANYFKPFYDKGGFEDIYKVLKEEGKTVKILPEGKNLFRAFELCDATKLKSIWVGLSPYYMIKNNIPVADGLVFSCGNTKQEQPSLKIIYDAMEDDLMNGLNLNNLRNPDLSYLANDGVLLLNSILTTPEGKVDSHKELWKPYMEFFFGEVLQYFSGIPIIFFGKVAQEYSPLVSQKLNYTLKVEHPSYSARQMRPMLHQNLFSWTNKILKENRGEKEEINWWNLPF